MKNYLSQIFIFVLLISYKITSSQSCIPSCGPTPVVVDISTGVDDYSGLPINVSSPDDNWHVLNPPTQNVPNPGYQQAGCSNGIRCLDPAPQFPPYDFNRCVIKHGNSEHKLDDGYPYLIVPVGAELPSRWISPYLCPIGHLENYQKSGVSGISISECANEPVWHYKGLFSVPQMCGPIKSIKIDYAYLGADGLIDLITVNGHPYTVNFPKKTMASSQGISMADEFYSSYDFSYSPIIIPINQFAFGPNGHLEIVVRVKRDPGYYYCGDNLNPWQFHSNLWHFGASPEYYRHASFILNGKITFDAGISVDFDFRDKDGTRKKEFCFGEDVILDGSKTSTGSYFIDLWEVNGSSVNWIASQSPSGWANGSPAWVNITELFENRPNPVIFQPNKTYRVKLAINSPCGWLERTKDFVFTCCDNSTDASFDISLLNNNQQLSAFSHMKGQHEWGVYEAASAIAGTYHPIFNQTGSSFNFDLQNPEQRCYYVTHKYTNLCGTNCDSQSLCKSECEEVPCLATAPQNFQYQGASQFTWSPVTGATSYVIQFVRNGCCGDGTVSTNDIRTVSVQANEIFPGLPLQGLFHTFGIDDISILYEGGNNELGTIGECYSVRIFAVCSDGSLSPGSMAICIHV